MIHCPYHFCNHHVKTDSRPDCTHNDRSSRHRLSGICGLLRLYETQFGRIQKGHQYVFESPLPADISESQHKKIAAAAEARAKADKEKNSKVGS